VKTSVTYATEAEAVVFDGQAATVAARAATAMVEVNCILTVVFVIIYFKSKGGEFRGDEVVGLRFADGIQANVSD